MLNLHNTPYFKANKVKHSRPIVGPPVLIQVSLSNGSKVFLKP